MSGGRKSRLVLVGDWLSDRTSRLFAHPGTQFGVILFCVTWFWVGLPTDLLTAALSILAITLTQMVLNGQYDREAEAHRRDVAMHAKLDELLIAMKGARDEMAGIEDLDEEDITELKEHVKEAIDARGEQAGNPQERAAAKQAVEEVGAELEAKAKASGKGRAKR